MKLHYLLLLFMVLISVVPIVMAQTAPLNTPISSAEQAQFNQILQPVMKIYNFIKYIASVVAGIFLLYAGITYMASGSDPKKREQAKNIAAYVIIGLIVIWAAPIAVGLLIA
jgi:hypothetical protein